MREQTSAKSSFLKKESGRHRTILIDTTFTVERAMLILSQLISSKINFHSLEKLSNEERFGENTIHSEKTVKELTVEKAQLIDWLRALDTEDQKIEINCLIELQAVDRSV